MSIPADNAEPMVGRLRGFGITEPWQAGLLLPTEWDDMRTVVTEFDRLEEAEWIVLRGRIAKAPRVTPGRPPRLEGYLTDARGRSVQFTELGDTRDLMAKITGSADDVILAGKLRRFGRTLSLTKLDVVDKGWAGRARPSYKGIPKTVTPETVRAKVNGLLRATMPDLTKWLWMELCSNSDPHANYVAGQLKVASVARADIEEGLRKLLVAIHAPKTPEAGEQAREVMRRLAALGIYRKSLANRPQIGLAEFTAPADMLALADKTGRKLSGDQRRAVEEIQADLRSGRPMQRMLVGDVGTGKTLVYGCAAAGVALGGGVAVVLVPSKNLARQVHAEILSYWPELEMSTALVVGDEAKPRQGIRLYVGTTALLSRVKGAVDLTIIDEQQRYSVKQRKQLVGPQTHSLEVSATCIPRSSALMKFGVVAVSELRETHTPKKIHTRVYTESTKKELFARVRETIKTGGKVLVIYPARDGSKKGKAAAEEKKLPSADEGFERWNKAFPGLVRLAHAGMDDEQNVAALDAVKAGVAPILISTLLVEVGTNIPSLKGLVVTHAERFGLVQLHQLRGRVAREGGEGFCGLYMPDFVGEASMERVKLMEKLESGFEVAEMDMRMRGFGDLGSESERQSGADAMFLFGDEGVSVDALDHVLKALGGAKPAEK